MNLSKYENMLPFLLSFIFVSANFSFMDPPTPFLGLGFLALGLSISLLMYMVDLKNQINLLATILIKMTHILKANGIDFEKEVEKKNEE